MPPPGRRRLGFFAALFYLSLLFVSTASGASAVLGIDLGTEYFKAALVKPGIPLEIVLTKDSKRKESAAIAFKPSTGEYPERLYGGDAIALSARFPYDVYPNLKTLLGLSSRNQTSVDYSSLHPDLQISDGKARRTVEFKSRGFDKGEEPFSVEELLAMQLQNIKSNAEAFAGKGSTVRDVVITLPSFYTAEEKRAVELASDLAGLKVLSLISDGLAVGLNYATSRTFTSLNEGGKPEYHLVYDMGAGSTTATVLRFQGRTVKDVGRFNKTIQEVQVIGSSWDRALGGDALNALVLDDMISKFAGMNRIKSLGVESKHIKQHGKTMAKLWKEAERMRQVLSANSETSSSFEGLYYEDVNFKYKLTRSDFEKLAATYAERVGRPIVDALASANLKLSDLESIILHGGAVRTPFVQRELESAAGGSDKIRTNVNSDEAAVFGAAFKAAGISPSFRVKDIRAGESAGYAIGVNWASEGKQRQQKLFLPTSQLGADKSLPFKLTEDFIFELYQLVPVGEGLEPSNNPVLRVQTENLTASVGELVNTFGCTTANISTKFSIRLSATNGLPEVAQGSVSCEVTGSDKKGGVVDDVKGFFGFGSKKGDQVLMQDEETEEPEIVGISSSSASSSSSESGISSSSKSAPTKGSDKSKDAKRVEIIPIQFLSEAAGSPQITPAELRRVKDRLDALDASDRSRVLREEAFNTLESFTYRVRDMVSEENFVIVSTEKERSAIEESGKSTSEWLYGEGSAASRDMIKSKLQDLRDLVNPIQKRKDETKKRPEEIRLLQEALEQTRTLIGVVKGEAEKASSAAAAASSESQVSSSQTTTSALPDVDDFADLDDEPYSSTVSSANPQKPQMPMYSPEDLATLTTAYESVQSWLDRKLTEQAKLSAVEDPAILSSDLAAKSRELNEVVMNMLRKTVKLPPKAKSTAKSKSSSSKSSKKTKATKTSTSKSTTNASEQPPTGTPAQSSATGNHVEL